MNSINESSLADLYQSTVRAFPNTKKRQHVTQPITIVDWKWTPFLGLNTLFVKGTAQNEDSTYYPMILFKKVNYRGQGASIIGNDEKTYQFEQLSTEKTDVVLRCDCADFYWRFNHTDHIDSSLYGRKRAKYESKGGPPANPLRLPGMCKHLIKMYHEIANQGILLN